MIKFHNTLGRKTEEFKPLKAGEVSLYTCGPTVYDYPQLGNLRSFVFDDTLRRVLEANGHKVRHVMNITDVGHLVSDMDEGEDKLEKGAEREGKTVWEVAQHYTKIFESDAKALNILPPNSYKKAGSPYAKATDFINEQVNLVKLLLDNGFAYKTEQAIYFDISKLGDYGELSGQSLTEKEVGARREVVTDIHKHHPQDFALWFFLVGRFKNHTMHWDSPWGAGFPGWHLECSAIIHSTLGEPLDIHTGGVDHIGTHHTNEIAQTEAGYGHKLSNYWLHNEFLLVDGQRMGKSLGNFYTLKDVQKNGYDPLALRLLFLQAHYRSQLNFTWESLAAAAQNLRDLQGWADLTYQPNFGEEIAVDQEKKLLEGLLAALNSDLNSAQALAILNKSLELRPTASLLKAVDELFGLSLSDRKDITNEEKSLIAKREESRQTKTWQAADEARDQLKNLNLEVNDTKNGPIWSRI